jgi:hypothetical protein
LEERVKKQVEDLVAKAKKLTTMSEREVNQIVKAPAIELHGACLARRGLIGYAGEGRPGAERARVMDDGDVDALAKLDQEAEVINALIDILEHLITRADEELPRAELRDAARDGKAVHKALPPAVEELRKLFEACKAAEAKVRDLISTLAAARHVNPDVRGFSESEFAKLADTLRKTVWSESAVDSEGVPFAEHNANLVDRPASSRVA